MKPQIKKLRTCAYSKDAAASFFGQPEQHTNKLVCDHPVMKINWTEKVCGPCRVYVNRNTSLEMPRSAPQSVPPPQPEPATPAPAIQAGPIVESPKQIQPAAAVERPTGAERAAAAPAPATAPARAAAKEKVPAKKEKNLASSKTSAPAGKTIKVTAEKPTTAAKNAQRKTTKK
jgi:hypothetical protein